MGSWIAASVLDDASSWIRAELEQIPKDWLVGGLIVLGVLFAIGLIRKIAWLAVMVALFGLIVGGLWIYSGQQPPG